MSARSLVAAAILSLSLVVVASAGAESPNVNSPATISGSAVVGAQLTAHNGTWLYLDGSACRQECTMTYQWQRCSGGACADISGATGRFYTVQAADAASSLRVMETMTSRDCGNINYETGMQECRDVSKSAPSGATAVVPGTPPTGPTSPTPPAGPRPPAPLSPAATAAPRISGLAMVDETLTATRGTWSGSQPMTLELQWQRCDAEGANCENLGLTGEAYKVIRYDVGKTLRVAITARNGAGVLTAVSQPTDVVTELQPTEAKPWIAATEVQAPHKLVLEKVAAKPQRLTKRSPVRVTLRVSDTRGFRIQGALVTAVALPGTSLVVPAEAQTSPESGIVTLTFTPGPRLNVKKPGSVQLVVTARRPGDRIVSPRAAVVRLQIATGPARAATRR